MSLPDEIQADLQRLAQLLTCGRYERDREGPGRDRGTAAAAGSAQQ